MRVSVRTTTSIQAPPDRTATRRTRYCCIQVKASLEGKAAACLQLASVAMCACKHTGNIHVHCSCACSELIRMFSQLRQLSFVYVASIFNILSASTAGFICKIYSYILQLYIYVYIQASIHRTQYRYIYEYIDSRIICICERALEQKKSDSRCLHEHI